MNKVINNKRNGILPTVMCDIVTNDRNPITAKTIGKKLRDVSCNTYKLSNWYPIKL